MVMKNIEILNRLVALQGIKNSDVVLSTPISYAVAYNIHALTEASRPYIEERKPLEEKYLAVGEDRKIFKEDTAGMAKDKDIKQLDEISTDVNIRKVKLSEFPSDMQIKYMDALFFMIEE